MPKKKNTAIKKREDADKGSLPEPVDQSDDCALSEDEKLQKELNWCIEQLRLGLMTQKSSTKQVQESVRFIKVLSSSSAPLVKKRQIMRQTFGDYRKKIADEEIKWRKETEKLKKKVAIAQTECGKSKSVFIKSAATKTNSDTELELALDQCSLKSEDELVNRNDEKMNDAGNSSEFRFNFDIPNT